MDKTKKIKQAEYFDLELVHLEEDAFKKDKEVIQLKTDLAHSRISTLQYVIKELQQEKIQLAEELTILDAKQTSHKQKRTKILDKIRKRLKLSGKFGYNPDTLEIIQ